MRKTTIARFLIIVKYHIILSLIFNNLDSTEDEDDDDDLSDLTDEEVINRYKNETDEEMKIYCKIC